MRQRTRTLRNQARVDTLAIVPSEASPHDSAPLLEVRSVADVGSAAPVAYVAPGRAAEIADVVFALASVAWKPLRRASS